MKKLLVPGVKFRFIDPSNRLLKDKTFIVMDGYVTKEDGFYEQMNIEKMGSKQMVLYTFTMLGKRVIQTIKYSDIQIVE